MMSHDPHILMSMLEAERDRTARLEHDLAIARQSAINWEHEAKALRLEIQRIRMSADTERIVKH